MTSALMPAGSLRHSILVGALMCAASAGALLARPSVEQAAHAPALRLDELIPARFGRWREAPAGPLQVVNPQQQALLERSYTQALARTYVHEDGYRIMLSLAYGANQRAREVHLPEVCYPAQGFVIQAAEAGVLATAFGSIPVRRLFATLGTRQEPLTYWVTIGDVAVEGKMQKRLVDLRYGLSGRVPEGLLFRVSSIDRTLARAFRRQAEFVDELLSALPPAERARLSGLGAAAQAAR